MLSDDENETIAQKHVRKNYPDCEILHRERRLEPDGIYFVATSVATFTTLGRPASS